MSRFWRVPLIAAIALGTFFIAAPSASAAPGFRGGFYAGGGWYGGGWGVGWGPGWYGPVWYGWYGPGYYYGYGPAAGKVKIVTPDKNASVFVDGGLVGRIAKAKKFPLRPGGHDVELRDLNGRTLFREHVQVIPGRTTEIHTDRAG
jgi:hypothetical protein